MSGNLTLFFLISFFHSASSLIIGDETNFNEYYRRQINEILTDITSHAEWADIEKDYLRNYLNNNSTINNLIEYSSHKQNAVSNSKECLRINNDNTNSSWLNYTYLTIVVTSSIDRDNRTVPYWIGLCIVDNKEWKDKNYKNILNNINDITDNHFQIKNNSFTFINHKTISEAHDWPGAFALYFSYSILLISMMFSLINTIPKWFYKYCFLSKSERNTDKSRKWMFNFVSCFNMYENTEECWSNEIITRVYNDNGLTYCKGLRGVFIIFTLIGLVYIQISQIPNQIYFQAKFQKQLKSFFFGIFFFGGKYGPRVLFSISGFICMYKFLNYLDEELDKKIKKTSTQKENQKQRSESEDSINDDVEIPDDIDYNTVDPSPKKCRIKKIKTIELFDSIIPKWEDVNEEHHQSYIPISSLLFFYLFQLHKFLLLIAFTMIWKYGIIRMLKSVNNLIPFILFFLDKYINPISVYDIISHALIFGDFYWGDNNYLYNEKSCILWVFWWAFNEVFFFVMTVPIIFICYKKQYNLPWIILVLIIWLISAKYWAVLLQIHNNIKTLLDILSKSPIYNWSVYLIGAFFGIMNYIFQKGTSDSYTGYLKLAKDFVFLLKYQANFLLYLFGVLEVIILIVIAVNQQIILMFKESDFNNSFWLYFYIIDTDIVVLLIHLFWFSFYVRGGNLITHWLSLNNWVISNKMYYGFILNFGFFWSWVFYQSETKVPCEMFSFMFYGFIIAVITFFLLWFHCILWEFPLKKVILFIKENNNSQSESSSCEA